MELKCCYKKTETVAIPADWNDPPLADIAKEGSPICYGIVQVGAYARGGVPVLAIKNLNTDYTTDVHRASAVVEHPYMRSRIGPGDVLISIKGTTGRVGIVPAGFHGNISRDIARLRLCAEADPEFYFQMLQSDVAKRRMAVAAVGTTRMELSIATLRQVRVPSPPTKTEQEAIASVLRDADALVSSMEQLIAKKRYIKQGAMHELLTGKRRLPGFGGNVRDHEHTAAGTLPSDWECEPVRNLAAITTGARNTQDRIEDGAYPFFVRSSTVERINTYSFDGEAVLTAGDGVGTGKVFHYVNAKFDFHQRVYMISNFSDRLDGRFFFLVFSTRFYDRIMSMTAKSSVDSVRMDMIADMVVPLPSAEEQTAIATILSDMDAEIAALEAKLTKTRQIKQGMMHELLTGRIRLVDTSAVNVKHASEVSAALAKPDPPHNWAFNEAVVIAVLADRFGKPEFPLGRLRYTKLSYLLHRKEENDVQGYLKKAAGPYNPKTRYAGPEKIAEQSGYARPHQNGKFKGFIAAENIDQARSYFDRWYGTAINDWLEQFRYQTNDELERLATVDMAMNELQKLGKPVEAATVRTLIESEPEWAPKLARAVFSDEGVAAAIARCRMLFAS